MSHLEGILEKTFDKKSPFKFEDLQNKINEHNTGSMYFTAEELVRLWKQTPFVPDLNKLIYKQIKRSPGSFFMAFWHARRPSKKKVTFDSLKPLDHGEVDLRTTRECNTAHCLAGWACVFGGKDGLLLENRAGSRLAGALIFAKSTGSIPGFFGDNHVRLEEMKVRVQRDEEAEVAKTLRRP